MKSTNELTANVSDVTPKPKKVATGLSGKTKYRLETAFWWILSISIFVGIWELCWYVGWADPLLMPPPHIFLSDLPETFKFFDRGNIIGSDQTGASLLGVLSVLLWTTMRVVAGLGIGFLLGVATGLLSRYNRLFGNLSLPLVTLLAPISPVAWLPVAIFLFGIGNTPAIFMVFVAVYFIITLATLNQIDNVPVSYIHVARIMGATRRQIYTRVILPSILPGLFMTLRLNLFAAWMVVLIAEAVGVGSGLGQIVMLARNTFNSSLVFFSMTLIGLLGFMLDQLLRIVQKRLLWWLDQEGQK
ncbi:ABC transporter permease [Marinobacter sp. EhC06]|uniref:ABC transporter permease n=1 Tax=Marinobacter TaxID=2742 RepID=UPI0007DA3658|nr:MULTISPECIES: ABC transporter permease [unclassified Marinobacter]OAN87160.1 ABC transporter permease [Marinobacter sp. EhN04]OAN89459.1 ABC transporter permease [Marinobacter sp. EhC06]PHS47505.1 MAG: ABC transporter permease [Marinobacter sp.]